MNRPLARRTNMHVLLQSLSGMSVTELARLVTVKTLSAIPRLTKYSVLLLFLIQIRSWPLTWHYRVWHPVFRTWAVFLTQIFPNLLRSASERKKKNLAFLEGRSCVGMNPFELETSYKIWAGPDDCDFLFHLSNSSYPKHLDAARFEYVLASCPTFLRIGGWMAVGATHFTFLREIPIFSFYEMRVSLITWDNKWIFVATRYVTKPKGKGKGKKADHKPSNGSAAMLGPAVHTANGTNTGTSTPLPPSDLKGIAAQLLERPEPDGATVNCIAVSELVCKLGRITVPPALVFAMDGFSRAPPAAAAGDTAPKAYSHTNPPPHWGTVRALRGDAHAGTLMPKTDKALREFYARGWREVPEGERWWETALGGEVEERRLKALPSMEGLRRGMEAARSV
ncbi:hypothetical protein C2E23DRAFT_495197 [Lenzites betulinus]|nr:hypothetical protein C2E23DRAFT_495197 [Lenzites betulinus]